MERGGEVSEVVLAEKSSVSGFALLVFSFFAFSGGLLVFWELLDLGGVGPRAREEEGSREVFREEGEEGEGEGEETRGGR